MTKNRFRKKPGGGQAAPQLTGGGGSVPSFLTVFATRDACDAWSSSGRPKSGMRLAVQAPQAPQAPRVQHKRLRRLGL